MKVGALSGRILPDSHQTTVPMAKNQLLSSTITLDSPVKYSNTFFKEIIFALL